MFFKRKKELKHPVKCDWCPKVMEAEAWQEHMKSHMGEEAGKDEKK